MYWKEIFYIVHVVTLEDTQRDPMSFCHSLNISSLNENHMLHLSVKIVIPYKGLHLLLAIIPEEYIIIIYCHWEWQWETVLLYSIAKQTTTKKTRSDVDLPAVSAPSWMCMLILHISLTVSSWLLSHQRQIYKKSCTMHGKIIPETKRIADESDEYKKVLKESAAVCDGTITENCT